MRIGVYAILDDEAIDGWIEATQAADARLVLSIGSQDTTPLEDSGVIVHHGLIEPWRDDDALNAALALVPSHIDVCFRVDMQDRPRHGWRAAIESAWKPGTHSLRHPYSNAVKSYYERRVHSRVGFRWSGPDCATLLWRSPDVCVTETAENLVVDYVLDDATDLVRLREGVDEVRSDDAQRALLYADALLREGYLQAGLAETHRYIALVGDKGNMVAYLWRQVASADEPNVFLHLLEAQKAYPSASNYLVFAENYMRNQEWGQCYSSCQYALSLLRSNPQPLTWADDGRLRGPLLHDLAATAAWNLWDFEAAYGHAVEALRRAPSNEVLRAQVSAIRAKVQAGATLDPEMTQSKPLVVKLVRAAAPVEPTEPPIIKLSEVEPSVAEQAS
jgi:hypothetical protein